MTKNNDIDLPNDFALILQAIQENGEEDFLNLVESLDASRTRLSYISGWIVQLFQKTY